MHDLGIGFMVFNATFNKCQLYRGGQFYWWSTRRKPPTWRFVTFIENKNKNYVYLHYYIMTTLWTRIFYCTTLWTRILYCSWNVKFDSFVLLAMSVAFWHSLDTETSFMCGPCNNLFILFVFHNYQYERPIMGGWIPQLWNTFLFTCLGFSTPPRLWNILKVCFVIAHRLINAQQNDIYIWQTHQLACRKVYLYNNTQAMLLVKSSQISVRGHYCWPLLDILLY
jgi:hypothetical protein